MSENITIDDRNSYYKAAIKDGNCLCDRQLDEIYKICKKNNIISKSNEEKDSKSRIYHELSFNAYKMIKVLQKYEYDMHYKYAYIYKINNSENFIKKLKESDEIKNYNDSKKITANENGLETILKYVGKPNLRELDNVFQLKFSYLINKTEETNPIHYPILVDIYKQEKILLIRFNAVSNDITTKNFYESIHDKVLKWLKQELLFEYEDINVFNIMCDMLDANPNPNPDADNDNIIEYKRHIEDPRNGTSKLRMDDDESLPIIDALKDLIEKFDSEHDKLLLKKIINDIDKKSRFIERAIEFKRKIGNKTINQVVCVSYKKSEIRDKWINLLHFYGGNQSREKIEYVIKKFDEYL